MTDTTQGAPAPKKRSFFKRAAWQDAVKKDDTDMFSHSDEFNDMVAEQNKRRDEEKRSRTHAALREKKRPRVSAEQHEPAVPRSGSASGSRAARTGSEARSRTPLSPAPAHPPPDSLAARYDLLAKSASSIDSSTRKESLVIHLDDDDDDDDDEEVYNSKSLNDNAKLHYPPWNSDCTQDVPLLPSKRAPVDVDDDDDDDEVQKLSNPTLAALEAKARQRAAQKAQSAATPVAASEPSKAPVAQLLINPQIPDAKPLMVKVRIDSTIEKPRQAWCGKQGFPAGMTQNVFFTWRGTRIYDSTTIKRLGIQVDKNGNVSVDGDSNIYDDVNLPKVVVEAWTEEFFQQRKREDAAEAAAKKKAAEAPSVVEEREPSPEPVLKAKKLRVVLKAKGKEDFRIIVNLDTTFGHLATAYKTGQKIDQNQPITLMFDGDRLTPIDTVADVEIEDMDTIEVLFK